MPRVKRPRRGSKGYWPRKRAERIYPSPKRPEGMVFSDAKPLAFAGYKAGMRRVKIVDKNNNSPTFGQIIETPVTVIDCPPVFVLGYRFYENTSNGLRVLTDIVSEKLPKYASRKLNVSKKKEEKKEPESFSEVRLIIMTQPSKSGLGKKTPEIFEVPVGGDAQSQLEYVKSVLGNEINMADIFKEGEQLDVSAVTTGKGYQGPVKRFGIAIQNRHVKEKHRHVGTLGSEGQQRVLPRNIPYPGQLGFFTRTEFNKRVIKIGEDGKEITPEAGFRHYGVVDNNYVLIEGSVPGPKKRLVVLRPGVRAEKPIAHEVKEVLM